MSAPWPVTPLGKVLKRVARFEERDDLTEYQFAGTYSFARGVFLGEKKFGARFKLPKVQRIHEGDFAYCKIMAWEGAFGIVPEEAHNCVMSGAFVVYEVDQSRLDPRYLDYYFKMERVWKTIGRQSTGTNVRRRSLHPKQFETASIPLPPLNEQRRIVSRIKELAALIEEARALRAKAREEAVALLGSELNRMFDHQKDSGLPRGWRWFTVGELLRGQDGIRTGPFGTLLSKSDFQSSGARLIGIACIGANEFHPERCDYISEGKAEALAKYGVASGDVIVARSGTVGRCCVVKNLEDVGIMSSNLMRLRFNVDKCDSSLACRLLNNSTLIHRQINEKCRGTTRTFFNQGILTSLEVPLPSVHEQHRVVAYLDGLQAQVDELTVLQDATQAELDALLPSVLDKAFKGEL
jgi:type I restriction enzyme S subunit